MAMIIKRVSLSTLHRMRSGTVRMGVRVNVFIDFNEFDYNGHARTHYNAELIGAHSGNGTFRAQYLSFPRLFVPGNFRSLGTKVPGNFRSRDLSFRGTFVPRTFRSQELSFLRLFYKALAMNADSYSNCQNLFRSRPVAESLLHRHVTVIHLSSVCTSMLYIYSMLVLTV